MNRNQIKFAVITVSDRVSSGVREDESGPLAQDLLAQIGEVTFYTVVPDGIEPVQGAVHDSMETGANIILTTGGTGITRRDQTPQAISSILTYDIPGIPAMIREGSKVATSALTRSVAGVIDDGNHRSVVISLPGSPSGVAEGISIISHLFIHLVDQLNDGDHPHTHSSHSEHFAKTYALAHGTEASTGAGDVIIARVQDTPISMSELEEAVTTDAAGAITSFCGRVRNHDHKKGVIRINYSAHPSASDIVKSIAHKVATEHGLHKIAVIHRVGQLDVGDVALGVAVSSDHRRESFSAVEDLVERIKLDLPVWKKQEFTDGTSEWSGMA
ncbi:molybdenum cofactor biosynthesis protein MoaE [Arcanobacterium phocae]|uniref:molybdenum cofactor biosynthesis protein MoaE n=1 Tax=Arcanobacterium phocae TaxID=131112 RepID=UPI001C123E6D|nr:molybdenum cofactor biosynthesis protein MoaE [Arcanobacterium phocae]